ncbi:nuclear body protein SP140-like protein [Nematolebias whitei]|uniref:nuclear body protein SP140-like protein n=1 Tax=Nematolebias whitei TaxID=451745 RepID=UPI00189B1522|nr:nuclear body protein SP140-like protein [Nematolebias whitei]
MKDVAVVLHRMPLLLKQPGPELNIVSDEEDEEGYQEHEVLSSETENSSDDTDEEMEDQDEQPESSPACSKTMFPVTCGGLSGILYKKRFAGKRGKSIRTKTSWMTPVEFMNEGLGHRNGTWRKDIENNGKALGFLLEENGLVIHSEQCLCSLCESDQEAMKNQRNDYECSICKVKGKEDVKVCHYCPRSFHKNCHVPCIEDNVTENGKGWKCTFCVFKASQKTEAVMSRQISQHMLECRYLLMFLCGADEEQKFSSNPRFDIASYSRFVQTLTWLDSIAKRLQRNQYQVVGEFVSDVLYILAECAKINQNNAEVFAMGEHLKLVFDQEFRKAFNIQD